ncbi:MAG: ABC transporter permease [Candidatus Pacebacteria bacterium]|nr:ABC transporter permease [Candidatus Paceibacterota bacterium]
MDYQELITESLLTLTLNKVRTGLAMLGVVIGIGSVIALMSLGQASQQSITSSIQSLGSNLLTISPGSQISGGIRGGSVQTLTYEDAQAIANSPQITTLSKISAEFSSRAQIVAGKNNTNTNVTGVLPDYADIRNLAISSGSFITGLQVSSLSKVAVLGPETVTDLFGENVNPIGRTIRLNDQVFNIIGVLQSKGGSGFMNQDDLVLIPLTTAQKLLFGVDYVSSISISAINEKVMTQAQEEIARLLLARHKISNPEQADFRIFSQEDILSTVTSVTDTFTTLLTGIAAISLVVGGIGIMNIMLVTVTERTREIGLRKALGAKRKIITAQFLTEAVMITFLGGIIGAAIGIGISYLLSTYMSLPFTLSLKSILLAFAVSAGVGILFGWYPAQKAAKLEPIEALRYE